MKTLAESAAGAVRPWHSIDAESELYDRLPQQSIDICLMCPHHAAQCDNCGDWNTENIGRPRKAIDAALLREMLKLRKCNREMCAALGVSKRTLQRAKKALN